MQLEGVYVSSPNKYFHAFQVSVIASSLFPCSFLLSEWVYGYMCLLKLEGICSYVVYFLFTDFEYLVLQFPKLPSFCIPKTGCLASGMIRRVGET